MDPNDQLDALSVTTDPGVLVAILEELGTFICIGMEDFIRSFDVHRGVNVLYNIAKGAKEEQVLVLVYRCMALVLEYVPHSSEVLVKAGVVPNLVEGLNKACNLDMIEELLKTVRQVSVDDSTGVLLQNGAVAAILKSMGRQDRRLHPVSIAILENILLKVNADPAAPKPKKKLFGKAPPPPPPAAHLAAVGDIIRKEIIPFLHGVLESLCVQDLDQGGAREVGVALCSCICTLAERCHRCVPDVMPLLARQGFLEQLVGMLQGAVTTNDERRTSNVLKALGVLCAANPVVVAPRLLAAPGLCKALSDLLVPEQQDFASTLKDPFGLQKEQERASGGAKSQLDLKGDVLYLIYMLVPAVPQALLAVPVPPVCREHQWDWEDDFHTFNPYEGGNQRVLEKAHREHATTSSVSGRGTSYSVDLNAMKQVNPSSGVHRNVRRHPLHHAYTRCDGCPKVAAATTSPGRKTSRLSKGSSPDKQKGEKEAAVLKDVALRPGDCYAGEEGVRLARAVFGRLASAVALYTAQCGDPARREWAAETLARIIHCLAAAVRGSARPLGWVAVAEELHQAAPTLTSALITLLGKGGGEGALVDFALVSVELLAAMGGHAAIAQQFWKGGLLEVLLHITAKPKSVPSKLGKRIHAFIETHLSNQGGHGDSGRQLAALARELSSHGGGAATLDRLLEEVASASQDLCHGAIAASGLVGQLLDWAAAPDAAVRHRRYAQLQAALAQNEAGAAALVALLLQSVVAMEGLPGAAAVDKAAKRAPSLDASTGSHGDHEGGSLRKKLRSSTGKAKEAPLASSSAASLQSADAAPARTATPGEFLRALGRRGFRVTFDVGDDADAAGPIGGKTITIDPLTTLGCVDKYLEGARAQGALPTSNGMRVLSGSSARHMLEGLASGPEDAGMLQELLRRLDEADAGGDDDDEDVMALEGQEVVIVDGSKVTIYDDPRRGMPAGGERAPALLPPVSHTFVMDGVELPKTATMLEVMRVHCARHSLYGAGQLEALFSPHGAPTRQDAIEKAERRVSMLKQKLQECQGKRAESASSSKSKASASSKSAKAQEDEYAAKLEKETVRLAELKKSGSEGADIWHTVVPLQWAANATGRVEAQGRPELFLSAVEGRLWTIDRAVLTPDDALLAAVDDGDLRGVLRVLKLLYLLTAAPLTEPAQPGHPGAPRAAAKPFLPAKQFLCPHITAKLLHTLSSNAVRAAVFGAHGVPGWCTALPAFCDFLFPIGARKEAAAFVAFGAQKAFIQYVKTRNRIPHADVIQPEMLPAHALPKMVVNRSELEVKASALLAAMYWRRQPVEIQYDGEEGTGLGPTLEFFTIVSKELLKESAHAWRGDVVDGFVMAPEAGCFPSPLVKPQAREDVARWQLLGRLVARAVLDGRLIDLPLSAPFLRLVKHWRSLSATACLTLRDLLDVDPTLGASLQFFTDFVTRFDKEPDPVKKQVLAREAHLLPGDDGFYFFSLPGADDVPLKPGGADLPVTCDNVREFLALAAEQLLFGTVCDRVGAFVLGFEETLPLDALQVFDERELCELVCGQAVRDDQPLWSIDELSTTIIADHGYSSESKVIHDLLDVLCHDFAPREQREFLTWATGCPRVPVGGIAAIGKITVVRKTTDASPGGNPDDETALPSCNTCFRYLKLPTYPSKAILAEKLRRAITEGSGSFSLS